jgi:hypothetical protein
MNADQGGADLRPKNDVGKDRWCQLAGLNDPEIDPSVSPLAWCLELSALINLRRIPTWIPPKTNCNL